MEKRRPHYVLTSILAQMESVELMNCTQSALDGIREAGMTKAEAFAVVQALSPAKFYKSMTTHKNYRIWQDVYHAEWHDKKLYVKFQQAGEFFIVSFKEL